MHHMVCADITWPSPFHLHELGPGDMMQMLMLLLLQWLQVIRDPCLRSRCLLSSANIHELGLANFVACQENKITNSLQFLRL